MQSHGSVHGFSLGLFFSNLAVLFSDDLVVARFTTPESISFKLVCGVGL